jgi:UDP-3-O-[3-hydroxymyristoyl] glucosamine N-acyltransferase
LIHQRGTIEPAFANRKFELIQVAALNSVTIADLAMAMGSEYAGDGAMKVSRAVHPQDSSLQGALAVAMTPEFVEMLKGSDCRAAVLTKGTDWQDLGLDAAIFVERPRFAISRITETFAVPEGPDAGIHPSAFIDRAATVGKNAAIGPFVHIDAGAVIGDNARIMSHVSISAGARIGRDAIIHSGVRIGRNVTIGDRVIIHQNAVVGADGFSFVTPESGAIEAARSSSANTTVVKQMKYARISSLAAVTIGDDVEIGACTTIDRGTLKDTSIGSGTKVDNQVQIAHNVHIGSDCLLCAQVGLAGSVEVGDRVVLGGKAGIADHVKIGSDVLVAAASAVASNVASRSIMMGIPAQPRDEGMRSLMAIRRLPRIIDLVEKLAKSHAAKKNET